MVVVSHNTREALRACLDSLPSGCEIVVVDSGSRDGSAEFVASAYPHVRILALDNVGFGAAANAGVATASRRDILLLNADARPLPGALEGLAQLAARRVDAGIIGPTLRSASGTVQRSVFASPRGPISLAAWAVAPRAVSYTYRFVRALAAPAAPRRRDGGSGEPREVVGLEYVQGSAMLLRREAFDAVGGFDESFFMYCEEADICYRIREAGWSVLFTPISEFLHLGGASAAQYPDAMYRALLRAHLLLLAKHRGAKASERARRLVVVAMRLRAMMNRGTDRQRYAAAAAALATSSYLGPTVES